MKLPLVSSILVVLAALMSPYAQDPHVHTEYRQNYKETRVYTDSMYVIDAPAQFMFVELAAHYPKQNLVKPPKEIYFTITSVTKQVLYREIRNSNKIVKLTADGESVSIDPPGYQELRGGTLAGKEVFFLSDSMTELRELLSSADGREAYDIAVPADSQIVNGAGVSGLVAEQIFLSLNHKKWLRISAAHKIEVKLGQTAFTLSDNQVNTVRDFARRISP